jgi:WD40 repeat protein
MGAGSGTLSPGGQTITLTRPDSVELWDIEKGARRAEVKVPSAQFAAFAPNEKTVAVATQDGRFHLIDVASQKDDWSKQVSGVGSGVVAFSADGSRIAHVRGNGGVYVFDAETGGTTASFGFRSAATDSAPVCVALDRTGRRVAYGFPEGDAWVIDLDTNISQYLGRHKGLTSIAFSPSGPLIATGSHDGTVKLWAPGGE